MINLLNWQRSSRPKSASRSPQRAEDRTTEARFQKGLAAVLLSFKAFARQVNRSSIRGSSRREVYKLASRRNASWKFGSSIRRSAGETGPTIVSILVGEFVSLSDLRE